MNKLIFLGFNQSFENPHKENQMFKNFRFNSTFENFDVMRIVKLLRISVFILICKISTP